MAPAGSLSRSGTAGARSRTPRRTGPGPTPATAQAITGACRPSMPRWRSGPPAPSSTAISSACNRSPARACAAVSTGSQAHDQPATAPARGWPDDYARRVRRAGGRGRRSLRAALAGAAHATREAPVGCQWRAAANAVLDATMAVQDGLGADGGEGTVAMCSPRRQPNRFVRRRTGRGGCGSPRRPAAKRALPRQGGPDLRGRGADAVAAGSSCAPGRRCCASSASSTAPSAAASC